MSVPPLPNDPDELNNEQGDYVEVPYNSLLEGNIYIFYNQWTLEMIRVDIMNVSYHDDNDIEITLFHFSGKSKVELEDIELK